jgi:hypothetical protein
VLNGEKSAKTSTKATTLVTTAVTKAKSNCNSENLERHCPLLLPWKCAQVFV